MSNVAYIYAAFIGVALNIWRDTITAGKPPTGAAPETFFIITEGGDFVITETLDKTILE